MDRRTAAIAGLAVLNFAALFYIVRFVSPKQFLLWYAPKDAILFGSVYLIANKKIEGAKPLPLLWRIAVNASLPLMLMR